MSRGAKVNLHACGSLPASQMKEHFEPLPEGEEERRCQACLMLAVCTWQAAPFPSVPCAWQPAKCLAEAKKLTLATECLEGIRVFCSSTARKTGLRRQ